MIASEHVANAILMGTAVQYRHAGAPLKPGREYPVYQARHQPALCRVAILTSTVQPAGPISLRDARREGHRSVTAAKSDWVRRHDAKWITAQLGKPDEPTMAARFDQRHAQRIIQLVTLSVVRDEPRYLASQGDVLSGRTSDGEYTRMQGRALCGEPVEVVPDHVLERYVKAAEPFALEQRERFRNQQQAQRQRKRNERLAMFRRCA